MAKLTKKKIIKKFNKGEYALWNEVDTELFKDKDIQKMFASGNRTHLYIGDIDTKFFDMSREIAVTHHENTFNRLKMPEKDDVTGDTIPSIIDTTYMKSNNSDLGQAIDIFEAMTSERSYKKMMSFSEFENEFIKNIKNPQFDEDKKRYFVDNCESLYNTYKEVYNEIYKDLTKDFIYTENDYSSKKSLDASLARDNKDNLTQQDVNSIGI